MLFFLLNFFKVEMVSESVESYAFILKYFRYVKVMDGFFSLFFLNKSFPFLSHFLKGEIVFKSVKKHLCVFHILLLLNMKKCLKFLKMSTH